MPFQDLNRDFFSRPTVAQAYAVDDSLDPGLGFILLKYHAHIAGQPLLDIGVGAGRTVHYLSRLSKPYVGIDYSEAMVTHCRARFPGIDISMGDARDLRRFDDGAFRFVVFSYNGISAIDHEGRLCALREIARVLQPGGLFTFSAHNRSYSESHSLAPRLKMSRNPLTLASNVARWMESCRNHIRMRQYEYACDEYALRNDGAHNYELIHYHITPEAQTRQLQRSGLALLDMFDANGNSATDTEKSAPWMWYVARKPVARWKRPARSVLQTRSMTVAIP